MKNIINSNDKTYLDGGWRLYYEENRKLPENAEYTVLSDLENSGLNTVSATVPGNFEIDLQNAGIIDDVFFGTNPIEAQKRENYHLWYAREFEFSGEGKYDLVLQGVDTFADIYLNGCFLGSTDNMFIPHELEAAGLKQGKNELVVHIKPVFLYARENPVDASSVTHQPYNAESLNVRKAAHMYGWDIMPRILSGGLWRSVYLRKRKTDCIKELYIRTVKLTEERAQLYLYFNVDVSGDFITDYSLTVKGKCKDSVFQFNYRLNGTSGAQHMTLEQPYYCWWTKGMGDPDLYDVTAELCNEQGVVDTMELKLGVRTFELERTSIAGENGKFCFYINGKPLFVRGTNWVPLDALHSRDKERLPKALELLDESGCNMVRCWGGNVYEDHEFFDFCDSHGIAVWQDFAMGCAQYPQNEKLCRALEKEATVIVKRYRQHPCIALWAGDNECDEATALWVSKGSDPNLNVLTRKVLPEVLKRHDPERIYIPSSPYIDEYAYSSGNAANTPERHLWGPRDCFKSEFYTGNNVIFASETGYHGCPSPSSIKKFINKDKLWHWENNKDWQAHATCMELKDGATYSGRIPLMAKQIKVLFNEEPESLERFAMLSQASQAEAMKFFVERFRNVKWKRTGIIWWNLVDGWPQFSDAVVDYYFNKKLAFNVIKRSQQEICLMLREPENGNHCLVGANETLKDVRLSFKLYDLADKNTVYSGEAVLKANSVTELGAIPHLTDKMHFYVMEWSIDGILKKNYYVSESFPYSFDTYYKYMCESGMWETDYEA